MQWARDMKNHLPPIGEERKKTNFCKYNDPDLQWQCKGQHICIDWSADGQGMNEFSCPKHGTVCIAGCAGCNKVRNKKEIHKDEKLMDQATKFMIVAFVDQSYAGNLDIMTAAGLRTAEMLAEEVSNGRFALPDRA